MSSDVVSGDAASASGGEETSLLSDLDIYFNAYPSEDNFTDFDLLDFLGGGKRGLNDDNF